MSAAESEEHIKSLSQCSSRSDSGEPIAESQSRTSFHHDEIREFNFVPPSRPCSTGEHDRPVSSDQWHQFGSPIPKHDQPGSSDHWHRFGSPTPRHDQPGSPNQKSVRNFLSCLKIPKNPMVLKSCVPKIAAPLQLVQIQAMAVVGLNAIGRHRSVDHPTILRTPPGSPNRVRSSYRPFARPSPHPQACYMFDCGSSFVTETQAQKQEEEDGQQQQLQQAREHHPQQHSIPICILSESPFESSRGSESDSTSDFIHDLAENPTIVHHAWKSDLDIVRPAGTEGSGDDRPSADKQCLDELCSQTPTMPKQIFQRCTSAPERTDSLEIRLDASEVDRVGSSCQGSPSSVEPRTVKPIELTDSALREGLGGSSIKSLENPGNTRESPGKPQYYEHLGGYSLSEIKDYNQYSQTHLGSGGLLQLKSAPSTEVNKNIGDVLGFSETVYITSL